MGRVIATFGLLVSLGCATTQSLGQSATIYADRDQLWLAAMSAIQDIGGRIVISNRSTGTIVGRLEVEGTPVDLTVSITGPPAGSATQRDYWDVSVRGALIGNEEPDEEWKRRIRYFEDQVLERISLAGTRPLGAMP